MNILLVFPRYPETFWNFRYALKFISKKAAYPPLGLLTVASMVPPGWNRKLVDMNTDKLSDDHLRWADYVFVSAMDIQRTSANEVIQRSRAHGVKVVAGGPLFTICHDEFEGVDHFVLGEAESIMPSFFADLSSGTARPVYQADGKPDVRLTPPPSWDLVDVKKYASLSLQYSRGCPHNCEFCDIVLLNGRVPRTKDCGQFISEMEAVYRLGWRGAIFVVDDNFIGNKKKLKAELLPAIISWMKQHKYPFSLLTQSSIALADDPELMRMMVQAGFDNVFVGVETPNESSLNECGKHQNTGRDLVASIRAMQNHGLMVYGGFIVGFDNDTETIFERQISFIQRSGIVAAMVGLLKAPRGTSLYKRLKAENRLTSDALGDSTDLSTNFIPRMNQERLISGYKQIISTAYSPRQYYERVRIFLEQLRPRLRPRKARIKPADLLALAKSMWYIGIRERGQVHYWRLLVGTLLQRPRSFHIAATLAIYGYHFRKVLAGYSRRPQGKAA